MSESVELQMQFLNPATDLPPSYATATAANQGLVSVDFLPNLPDLDACVDNGCDQSLFYESFPVLVERANQHLLSNLQFSVNTCESVEFTTYNNGEEINLSSIYVYRGEGSNRCVRGLRLWLKRCSRPPDAIPEQIGYYDFVPQLITSVNTENFDYPSCDLEKLDAVTIRVNKLFRDEPVPGRIVTIETQPIKWGSKGPLPDQTTWTERGSASEAFIILVRIFYVLGKPTPHQIAFVDFLPHFRPHLPDGGGDQMFQTLETFPDVVARARQWLLSVPPNFHPVNVQTVTFRYTRKEEINTLNMSYSEDSKRLSYLRYLRVGYLVEPEEGTVSRSTVHLDCKLFVPRMHREPEWFAAGKFEDALKVRERIDQWVGCTGAVVISVESLYMRISGGGESEYGFDAMQTWNQIESHAKGRGQTYRRTWTRSNERFACLYRVYTDGSYADPPGLEEDPALERYAVFKQGRPKCTTCVILILIIAGITVVTLFIVWLKQ